MAENVAVQQKVERSRVVNGNLVTAQLVTKKDKTAQGITCNWVLDFSDVAQDAILELASRAVIIGEQDVMRKLDKPETMAKQNISVKEFLARERGKPGPLTADKAMVKLDDEQKRAMFELLKKEMAAKAREQRKNGNGSNGA